MKDKRTEVFILMGVIAFIVVLLTGITSPVEKYRYTIINGNLEINSFDLPVIKVSPKVESANTDSLKQVSPI